MAQYDVTIIGAGFAGLTLAYQLLQNIPNVKIALIHERNFPVPDAAYKVGESVNEVGGLYLSHILDLHDYMEDNHFKKMGMRFFKEEKDSFHEMGVNHFPINDSFHFEHGKFENDLFCFLENKIDIFSNHKFIDFHNEKKFKNVTFIDKDGHKKNIMTKWIADASGMRKVLSRKFNITHKLPLSHSSVWVRVSDVVDVNDIYINNENSPFDTKNRARSSIHVEGLGYWIWILPLSEKTTSLGIVFDEKLHSFNDFSSQDKMMLWLSQNEKLLSSYLEHKQFDILDFKILRKFATISDYATSTDRWALTGDAYGFWDPYYSGGFDLIALQNTMLTHNIQSDLKLLNIQNNIKNNNILISYLMSLMENMFNEMYTLKNNWYYLVVKYCIDSISYFGSFCIIMKNVDFSDDKYVNDVIPLIKDIISIHSKITSFLRSSKFNEPRYTAPSRVLLQPTLFSNTNMNINAPNGDKEQTIKALKKNINIMKYQYYYLLEQHDYLKLLYSSINDQIDDNTNIDFYAKEPLSLLQEP